MWVSTWRRRVVRKSASNPGELARISANGGDIQNQWAIATSHRATAMSIVRDTEKFAGSPRNWVTPQYDWGIPTFGV